MSWLDVDQQEAMSSNSSSSRRHFSPYDEEIVATKTPMSWSSHHHHHRHHHHHTTTRGGASQPNPNDEETVPTVTIQGNGPGRRAGHTATAVNRQLYVFGGSCGSDYLNDFFVLDTDPQPRAAILAPASLQLVEHRLRHFFNEEDFSDVTFVVEGQRVYGHKLVLSIVSDCFRAMFTAGFRESEENAEIEIPECSYDAFLAMMEYIYTGKLSKKLEEIQEETSFNRIVDLMELADQYFLDHLKQKCEIMLQPHVNTDTVEYLHQVAQKTNAMQLLSICEHFQRNQEVYGV